MRLTTWALFVAIFAIGGFSARAECVNDHRSNKNAGILITDFTITGTQTISTTDLARITSDMIGSCFDEDSEEMEERVRASFQDRGYFKVEVKSLRFKPRDPLGVPKPVTLEGEVSEGARYKLAEITFVENHAFSSEKLRQQFPLKRGDLFERGKVAIGLQSLRKLYGTHGFLDWTAVPETKFGSNASGISAEAIGVCVHSMRATAATNALSHEADIAKVQEWLGHANVSTTRLYDRRKSKPDLIPYVGRRFRGVRNRNKFLAHVAAPFGCRRLGSNLGPKERLLKVT
jgi:hypothetical protein